MFYDVFVFNHYRINRGEMFAHKHAHINGIGTFLKLRKMLPQKV